MLRGSIRGRILVLFLLSVIAFSGAMGYLLTQLRTIGEGLEALERGYLPLTGPIARMEFVLNQLERDGERFLREGQRPDAGHRSSAALRSAQIRDAAQSAKNLVLASAQISTPSEAAQFHDLEVLIVDVEAARQVHDDAFEDWLSVPSSEPYGLQLSALGKARTELSLAVSRLSVRVEARIAQVSATTARARERTTAVSITLATLATLFAAVLAGMALVTLRPIELLTREVQRLGAGEYTGPVQAPTRGAGEEVAVLAQEFNAMAAAVVERDRRLSERASALDKLSLRLRQILDTIQAGLIVTEGDQIAVLNPAAQETWRARTGEPLPQWMKALEPGRHHTLSHEDRLFNMAVVPFGTRGVLYVGEDVTEQEAVRERLTRAERLAVVGQMLAQITHEVRNPLNAMSLNAELLADEIPEDGEASDILETIIAEIRRLETLTGRYLTLSRRRQQERSPEDPAAMIREILRAEEASLQQAQVSVQHQVHRTSVVDIDGDAIRRAVRNLLLNSVEAGARHIRIESDIDHAQLTVSIADDGPGMSRDQKKNAFEPFFTTKAQGTGLGLAISRQELEDIGGTIHCERTSESGSTFVITCPL